MNIRELGTKLREHLTIIRELGTKLRQHLTIVRALGTKLRQRLTIIRELGTTAYASGTNASARLVAGACGVQRYAALGIPFVRPSLFLTRLDDPLRNSENLHPGVRDVITPACYSPLASSSGR